MDGFVKEFFGPEHAMEKHRPVRSEYSDGREEDVVLLDCDAVWTRVYFIQYVIRWNFHRWIQQNYRMTCGSKTMSKTALKCVFGARNKSVIFVNTQDSFLFLCCHP